jgi:RNA polymerase sigma-70 factor, ECF subfamily
MTSLATVFLARLPDAVRAEHEQRADLETSLASIVAAARAAWPGVTIEEGDFVAHLAERMTAGAALADMHASDLYLACACARGSAAALRAFDSTYFADVELALRRVPDVPADEVRQLVREKLFVGKEGGTAKIGEYSGRSALRTWLRVVASRVAVDLLRTDKRGTRDDDDELGGLPSPVNDPELAYLKGRYRHELETAVREAAALLEPRDRNLLRHHHVDGLTLDELAALYRVHRVTIARRLGGVREKLASDTRRLLLERYGLGAGELDSLMVLVRSQFDVSMRSLLGEEVR